MKKPSKKKKLKDFLKNMPSYTFKHEPKEDPHAKEMSKWKYIVKDAPTK